MSTAEPVCSDGSDYGELMACKGRRITGEEISRQGRTMEEFERLPKMHVDKVRVAARLRKKTTLSLRWIVGRLHAGTPGTLAVALCKANNNNVF